jgi:hypothetical protein
LAPLARYVLEALSLVAVTSTAVRLPSGRGVKSLPQADLVSNGGITAGLKVFIFLSSSGVI